MAQLSDLTVRINVTTNVDLRHAEQHVTVAHRDDTTVTRWTSFCKLHDIKPLYIELNNFERQLMCAMSPGQVHERAFERAGFHIIRNKLEVQPTQSRLDITSFRDTHEVFLVKEQPPVESVKYYEVHLKFDGSFLFHLPMTSRDLLRPSRWYWTVRQTQPFDGAEVAKLLRNYVAEVSAKPHSGLWNAFVGFEYEAAVNDTNRGLDRLWEEESNQIATNLCGQFQFVRFWSRLQVALGR